MPRLLRLLLIWTLALLLPLQGAASAGMLLCHPPLQGVPAADRTASASHEVAAHAAHHAGRSGTAADDSIVAASGDHSCSVCAACCAPAALPAAAPLPAAATPQRATATAPQPSRSSAVVTGLERPPRNA